VLVDAAALFPLGRVEIPRDFGRGFYVTTFEKQAVRWAVARFRLEKGQGIVRDIEPVVLKFIVDRERLGTLRSLWFVRGSKNAKDFWSLVTHCRRSVNNTNRTPGSTYDLVIGPVAKNLGNEKVFPSYDQIGFHSPEAAKLLTDPEVIEV
jgi:hypothetical protein